MPKLVLIQVLRAAAALSIALWHAQYDAEALAARLGQSFARLDILPWPAGVDIFFVISGFIMVHASGRLFGARESRRPFLARRIARIVPIYWAATTLFLLVFLAAPALLGSAPTDPWLIVASYLFIPAARPDGTVQPVYGLGWTLNYEMFFYVLFAFAVAWPRRQAVLGLILALSTLAALSRWLAPLPLPFGFWFAPIILEFAFGMALAFARAEGFRLEIGTRAGLAAAGLVLLSLDLTRPEGLVVLGRAWAWGVPAALLVAAAGLGKPVGPESALTRFGETLGDASYALYLVHPFVIRALNEFVWRSGLAALIGPWGFVALALTGSAAAAIAVYRLFERPMTAKARRLLGSDPPKNGC